MSKNITKVNVRSINWSMDVEIDNTIFDDVPVEACTRCVEQLIRSISSTDEFLLNPVIIATYKIKNKLIEKPVNAYKVLLNTGLPVKAELLRKTFLTTTEIDLAIEPLSASTYGK